MRDLYKEKKSLDILIIGIYSIGINFGGLVFSPISVVQLLLLGTVQNKPHFIDQKTI